MKLITESMNQIPPTGYVTEKQCQEMIDAAISRHNRNASCLLYTSPSPRDKRQSRMPSSA